MGLTWTDEREAEIRTREHREALYGMYKYDVAAVLAELDATRAALSRVTADNTRLIAANEGWHRRVESFAIERDALIADQDAAQADNARLRAALESVSKMIVHPANTYAVAEAKLICAAALSPASHDAPEEPRS